jgi:hypothetical protein
MVTKVVCDQLVVKEQDSKSKLSNLDIYSSKDSCRRMVKNVEKGNYNTLAGGSIGMDGHASFRKDTNISLPYLYMLQYSHLEY